MKSDLHFNIIRGWQQASILKEEWAALEGKANLEHPFMSFAWLDCWIKAFATEDSIQVITVRHKEELRAVLPLMKTKLKRLGISFKSLSCPANGHSARSGAVVAPDDTAAIEAICDGLKSLRDQFHICEIPAVAESSETVPVLQKLSSEGFHAYSEHEFTVPQFSLPEGWENYLLSKSKKFRKRLRESQSRAKKIGQPTFEVFGPKEISGTVLERLQTLEATTWQHQNGTGLFSTPDNQRFYSALSQEGHRNFNVYLAFLQIDGQDIAYEIAACRKNKAYFLKYGFNPEFANCRPGVLVQAELSRYVAERGVNQIDLGPEASDEKARWETHQLTCANWWLINENSLGGKCLKLALKARKLLKATKSPRGLRHAEHLTGNSSGDIHG